MRRLVVRELIGLLIVLAVLVGIQLAFDDLAPVWALVVFVVGWIAFRGMDVRRRYGKDSHPTA